MLSDLTIMAVYATAIIIYQKNLLLTPLICFVISCIFYHSEILSYLQNYQTHLIYLILFSLPVNLLINKHKVVVLFILIMMIFQGIMVIDAILYEYQTVLYVCYPTTVTCLHFGIVASSFWNDKCLLFVRRLFDKLRSVKIDINNIVNNRNTD